MARCGWLRPETGFGFATKGNGEHWVLATAYWLAGQTKWWRAHKAKSGLFPGDKQWFTSSKRGDSQHLMSLRLSPSTKLPPDMMGACGWPPR